MVTSTARAAGVIACLVATTTMVQAAQSSYAPDAWWDDRFYIAPLGTYTFADNDRKSDDGWGWGLALGKALSPGWDLELRYSFENLDRSGGDWHNQTLAIDAKWYFLGRTGLKRWNTLQPYGIIGAGVIKDDNGSQNRYSPMANVGLGAAYPISRWGRLFLDGRYRWDDNRRDLVSSGNFSDWVVSFGLQIPLGTAPAVAQPVRAEPPPPAPAPPPPPAAKPQPKPAPAPKKPVTKSFTLSADTLFDFDSARLTTAGQTSLDNMISEKRQAGITTVSSMTIVGHTDPLGREAYNQKLSERRAAAVRDYVVSKGIPPGVIQTEGRGESQPKVTEADCKAKGEAKTQKALIACLAPDRRVDITATGTTTSTE